MISAAILQAIGLGLLGAGHPRVDNLSLDVEHTLMRRDPYWPNKRDWKGYVGLNWDITSRWMGWDNTVFFYGDSSQVRHIGWHYRIYMDVTENIQIYHRHVSEHSADIRTESTEYFPLNDSVGIRINFNL